MGYWFWDFPPRFEKKQSRTNRVIAGLRYWSSRRGKSKTAEFFFYRPVTIATNKIPYWRSLDNIVKNIEEVEESEKEKVVKVRAWLSYKTREDKLENKIREDEWEERVWDRPYSVIQISMPKSKQLIDKLNNNFQKGDFDKVLGWELDYLYHKLNIDEKLKRVFDIKNEINELEDSFRKIIKNYLTKQSNTFNAEWPQSEKLKFPRLKKREDLILHQANYFVYDSAYTLNKTRRSEGETNEILKQDKLYQLKKFLESNVSGWASFKEKLSKMIKESNSLLYNINQNCIIQYNLNKRNWEINLYYDETKHPWYAISGIHVKDEKLNSKDFRNQVMAAIDIEKPLWKKKHEKILIKRRDYLTKLKQGYSPKRRKHLNAIKRLEAKLEKLPKTSKKQEFMTMKHAIEKKINVLEKLADVDYSKERAETRIDKLIKKIEAELTVKIGNRKIKLWQEKYDAEISWIGMSIKHEDGSSTRKLLTLRKNGLGNVNGYNIEEFDSEFDLVGRIDELMRKYKVFAISAYVLPYDVIQIRDAALRLKQNPLDITIKGIPPSRAFVRDYYQEMRKSVEMIDLNRPAFDLYPYLRGKNPKGNHKLEYFVNYLEPNSFKKSFSHEGLREGEIKAMDDVKKAKKMAKYSTGDVEIMDIIIKQPYMEIWSKLLNLAPSISLTEASFSPNIIKRFFDYKYWKENHNLRYFGYERKKREDEVQIAKKRIKSFKNAQLKAIGIPNVIEGKHKNVWQVFLPILQQSLKEFVFRMYPELKIINDIECSVKECGIGKYAYLSRTIEELLIDWNATEREQLRYENGKRFVSDTILNEFYNNVPRDMKGKLLRYNNSLENLKNFYRSIYVSANAKTRKMTRANKTKEIHQTSLFPDMFLTDNKDLIRLKENKDNVVLSKSNKSTLKRFLTTFNTLKDIEKELSDYISDKYKDKAGDTIYGYNQRSRAARYKTEFYAKWKVTTKKVTSNIERAYSKLSDELKKMNAIPVLHRGDYLFIKKVNGNKFSKDSKKEFDRTKIIIPIRFLDEFVV